MEQPKTIFVYNEKNEASEILNTADELTLWAKAGYMPKDADKPKAANYKAPAAAQTETLSSGTGLNVPPVMTSSQPPKDADEP